MAPSSLITSATTVSRSSGLGEPARPDLRVVALGGGTGLPTVLRGLRASLFESGRWDSERDQARLTAIVTVADDGGSSGMLRASYQLPSPGDIRNCLLALAGGDPALSEVFDFRFTRGSEVAGHSLGNLILTALTELEHDFSRAVARVGRMLSIRGRVLPSTTQNVMLYAELSDGTVIEGESRLAGARSPIRRLRLHPSDAAALPEALDALRTWRPDVLVSDIEMPGENGYSLIRRVRALDAAAGGRTPAVALTAYGRTQDRVASLTAGYNMHVPKPVDPGEFTAIIASVAGRPPAP